MSESFLRVPRVFISYAHDPEIAQHRTLALELAQSLRLRGVEANIDQFVEHDPPIWPRWMLDEINGANFVLCLASPAYKKRAEGSDGEVMGRGVKWEGAIITEVLYSSLAKNHKKFISVITEGCSEEDIPDLLFPCGMSFYRWPQDDEDLYRRITGQPRAIPFPLGQIVRL